MEEKWKSISIEAAKQHSLYGRTGWLLFFCFTQLFSALIVWGGLRTGAYEAGLTVFELLSFDFPGSAFLKIAIFLDVAGKAMIFYLFRWKSEKFRKVSALVILTIFPIYAIAILFLPTLLGVGKALFFASIQWAIYCSIWITYLQLSRRVRVTFEHMVKFDDPILTGISATHTEPRTNSANDAGTSDASKKSNFEERLITWLDQPNPTAHETQKISAAVASQKVLAAPEARKPTPPEDTVDENQIYTQIAHELETTDLDKGLWTRLYAECEGLEQQIKVRYIKERAARLIATEQIRIVDHLKRRQELELAQKLESETKLAAEEAYFKLPNGLCPLCDLTIPLSSKSCARCKAEFGVPGGWHVLPPKPANNS